MIGDMGDYDRWKTDPDFDGRESAAIEAQERAEEEERDRIERLECAACALDLIAHLIRCIASDYTDKRALKKYLEGAIAISFYPQEEEIKF